MSRAQAPRKSENYPRRAALRAPKDAPDTYTRTARDRAAAYHAAIPRREVSLPERFARFTGIDRRRRTRFEASSSNEPGIGRQRIGRPVGELDESSRRQSVPIKSSSCQRVDDQLAGGCAYGSSRPRCTTPQQFSRTTGELASIASLSVTPVFRRRHKTLPVKLNLLRPIVATEIII